MRKIAGWVLVGSGVLLALLGVVLAVALGPDNRRTTGPHKIDTNSSVVVTAPRAVEWANVQVDVLAEVPAKKPVFVGVGSTVDVRALVDDVDRLEITEFDTPWKPKFVQRKGTLPTVQGAPTAVDWWLDSSAGLGGASMSSSLPAEPVSIAIVSIGSSKLSGLEVTFAYGIKGGFAKGIGLALIGMGLAGIGLNGVGGGRWRGNPRQSTNSGAWFSPIGRRKPAETREHVTYIYIDDDGVEHEITEAELAEMGDYEIVDDPEQVDVGPSDDPDQRPERPSS